MADTSHRPINRVVKLVISMSFFAMASVWRAMRWVVGRPAGATWTILYYHAIRNEERQAFAAQMDAVTRVATAVPLQATLAATHGKRYCSITFDDGFENTIRNAVPELVKRNLPGVIFVTTGAMGNSADWWPESSPEHKERIAGAEQIQSLPDLITIGSHTLTHPKLPLLSEAEARREICDSRAQLEKLLQRRVAFFSFPYGEFSPQLVGLCREAGYERVYTSLPGNALSAPQAFAVGRVSAEPTDWPLEFRLKVLGAYGWLPLAISIKRALKRLGTGRFVPVHDGACQNSAA
jgi:peptidoglycan/xylan/chitin deacetylase (PgdA/CDA1 family)